MMVLQNRLNGLVEVGLVSFGFFIKLSCHFYNKLVILFMNVGMGELLNHIFTFRPFELNFVLVCALKNKLVNFLELLEHKNKFSLM